MVDAGKERGRKRMGRTIVADPGKGEERRQCRGFIFISIFFSKGRKGDKGGLEGEKKEKKGEKKNKRRSSRTLPSGREGGKEWGRGKGKEKKKNLAAARLAPFPDKAQGDRKEERKKREGKGKASNLWMGFSAGRERAKHRAGGR